MPTHLVETDEMEPAESIPVAGNISSVSGAHVCSELNMNPEPELVSSVIAVGAQVKWTTLNSMFIGLIRR